MAGNITPEDAAAKMQEDAIKLLTGSQINESPASSEEQPESNES